MRKPLSSSANNSYPSLYERLRKLFAPPVFEDDEDKTRFASILNTVTWCTFIISLSGLYLPMWVGPPIRTYVFVTIWSLLCITVLILNYNGYVRAGCILSVTGSWTVITFVVLTAGGIYDPTFGLYIVIIAVAGLFFGWKTIVGTAIASVFAGFCMMLAERYGLMHFAQRSHSPQQMLVTHAIILIMSAVIISVAVLNLVKALARARHEIVERKKTESTLRDSEERYRALIDTTGTGYVIIDTEGKVLDANREYVRLTGHAGLNEILGHTVLEWTAEKDLVKNAEAVRRVASEGFIANFEIEYVDSRGTTTPVELNATCVDTGGTRRILTLCRDITERRKADEEVRHMEERLRQSEKMEAIGRLAGGIAHDSNNQLAGIMGCADMLAMNVQDEKLREYAEIIVQTSRRAADLNNQLLAFARKGKYISTYLDVHTVISEVITLLKHSVDKRIKISRNLNAPNPVIKGDTAQIQNSLLNLTINASEAMPGGGQLSISTNEIAVDDEFIKKYSLDVPPGNYIEISVSDTGTGMDEETIKHMFEPFYSTKKDGRNTGLGMSAVYGTVKMHSGAIHVLSKPGQGSEIILLFPVAEAVKTDEGAGRPDIITAGAGHILVMEDDEMVGRMITSVLRNYGYSVTLCRDGEEAVEEYSRSWRTTDLVILDMMTPKKTGRETFLEMKKINPGARAILSSGYSMEGEAQKLMGEGIMCFVHKPYRVNELLDAVGRVLIKR